MFTMRCVVVVSYLWVAYADWTCSCGASGNLDTIDFCITCNKDKEDDSTEVRNAFQTKPRANTLHLMETYSEAEADLEPLRKFYNFTTNLRTILSIYNYKVDTCVRAYEEFKTDKFQKAAGVNVIFHRVLKTTQIQAYRDGVLRILYVVNVALQDWITRLNKRNTKSYNNWYKLGIVLFQVTKITIKILAMNGEGMHDIVKLTTAWNENIGSEPEEFSQCMFLKETFDILEDGNELKKQLKGNQSVWKDLTTWFKKKTQAKGFEEIAENQDTIKNLKSLVDSLENYHAFVRANCGTSHQIIPKEIMNAMGEFDNALATENGKQGSPLPIYHKDAVNLQQDAMRAVIMRQHEHSTVLRKEVADLQTLGRLQSTMLCELKLAVDNLTDISQKRKVEDLFEEVTVQMENVKVTNETGMDIPDTDRRRLMNRLLKMSTSEIPSGSEERRRP